MVEEPRRIVYLSTSPPSREMRKKGVFELPTVRRLELKDLLDFESKNPTRRDIEKRSNRIARMADETGAPRAMIMVPIFMVSTLELELRDRDIKPVYPIGEIRRYRVNNSEDDEGGLELPKCYYHVEAFLSPPSPDQ